MSRSKILKKLTKPKDFRMTIIDLSSYNLGELKGLQHDIEQEIKSRQHQNLQKAREQILAIAQEAGVSVEELFGGGDKNRSRGKGGKFKRVITTLRTTCRLGASGAVNRDGSWMGYLVESLFKNSGFDPAFYATKRNVRCSTILDEVR